MQNGHLLSSLLINSLFVQHYYYSPRTVQLLFATSPAKMLLLTRRSFAAARQMSSVTRKVISTENAPGAIGPYSQAVQVDNTLYISGSLGLLPDKMTLAEGGVKEEAHQSLEEHWRNLESSCMDDFATVNDIYKQYFKSPFPARAAYQVAKLPKDARVEIEAIAVLGQIKDA
ncbi:RutC family protein [Aphelenchoides bicaudatus]|nr:RutC family protein [Aphelenchoides bicaudatus]